mmetsp:Transcript_14533/g.16251  ORF Transcript_14533/g.16251 Transcript_14533/m.16251 type:complete len:148 (-) Transcript_14533:35-478(-)
MNCLIRIGVFLLFSGLMCIAYYKLTDKHNWIVQQVEMANVDFNEKPFGPYMYPEGEATIQSLYDCYYQDLFIELVTPILLVVTGWRILLALPLLHFVVYPSMIYNTLGQTRNTFQNEMGPITFLQTLGILLYIFTVRTKAAVPHPAK